MNNYKVGNYYLDDAQMQLINSNENTIVIAGAGAGKTLTIIGKVNHLIENGFATPEEILLISFTNASVNDIKSKINSNINIFTFHKLAMFILDKCLINYKIVPSNTFKYIIQEQLITIDIKEQKYILNFLNLNCTYHQFLQSSSFNSFCKFIETFINLFKTNGYTFAEIQKIKLNKLEKNILLIIFKIFKIYILEKQSTNSFDFDDLIIQASNQVHNIPLQFKYIIIDEFQDTSFLRLNLIKQICLFNGAKVIVVGDDWQSIYHFSGCDLKLFLNFDDYFDNVKKIKLINTYRNSQELINIASKFIIKNPKQIKKDLKSSKHSAFPLIFVPYTNKKATINNLLKKILIKSKDIMILSRNTKDISKYFDTSAIHDNKIIFNNLEIPFYTVHKSKGLEAEYVIVLNCNDEQLGFPNKIENNPLIDKIFKLNEIPYAEERRLFYVAITRCKISTFLVYDINKPSLFIKEIKKRTKKELKSISYFQK